MKVCQNQDSLTIGFFLGTDYTENTDFLYSFFREIRVIRA